jgi:hypothetical protein
VFWKAPQARRRCPQSNNLKIAKTQRKTKTTTENTSRACCLENKVDVLKSSSVKNKKQHKKNILKIAKAEETPKQHGECIKSLIF